MGCPFGVDDLLMGDPWATHGMRGPPTGYLWASHGYLIGNPWVDPAHGYPKMHPVGTS